MSIQYRSTASTVAPAAGGVTSLATAGSVPAGDYFVVQLASQAAVGVAVPNVDFVGNSSTNLSGSSGQVYLANSTTAIDPDGAGDTTITDPAVIDFVGYGTAAIKEGATAAPSPAGNAASITRDEDDTDTDVNGADFASSDPTPGAGFAPPPPPEEFTGTIAEIQGTDADVSPHVGDIATTTGRGHREVPARRPQGLQRLLPPDRRHRRCHRRHARRLGRGLRLHALLRRGEPRPSARRSPSPARSRSSSV